MRWLSSHNIGWDDALDYSHNRRLIFVTPSLCNTTQTEFPGSDERRGKKNHMNVSQDADKMALICGAVVPAEEWPP
jgi:hypothetical protein